MADKDPKEGMFELRKVRITYPHLHVAHTPKQTKQNPSPKSQFQTGCIIDGVTLGDPEAKKLLSAAIGEIRRVAQEKFKDRAAGFMSKILHSKQSPTGDIVSDGGIRSPFGDGSTKDFGAGTLTFNLKSDYAFNLVDQYRRGVPQVDGKNPEMFYPGCYVDVFVRIKAWATAEGAMGVSLYPIGMKFAQDGERLDNRIDAETLWGGPADPTDQTDLEKMLGNAA